MRLIEFTPEEKAAGLVWEIGFGLLELFTENYPQAAQLSAEFDFLTVQQDTTLEQMDDLYTRVTAALATLEHRPAPELSNWREVGGD